MGSCGSCGSSVPDGQGVCSMCYGDPDYGSDGHYRRWLEEMQEEQQWEEQMERLEQDRIREEHEEAMKIVEVDRILYDASDISCRVAHTPFQAHNGDWWVPVQVLGYGENQFYSVRKLTSLRENLSDRNLGV